MNMFTVNIPLKHIHWLEHVVLKTLQLLILLPVFKSMKAQVPLPLQSLGHLMAMIVMMILINVNGNDTVYLHH